MKKIIFTAILLTCTITGVMHGNDLQHERKESILANQTYMSQIPDIISYPIFDPITH